MERLEFQRDKAFQRECSKAYSEGFWDAIEWVKLKLQECGTPPKYSEAKSNIEIHTHTYSDEQLGREK